MSNTLKCPHIASLSVPTDVKLGNEKVVVSINENHTI